ncbi:MAG: DNA alkylation repair protein [Minisyncoccia bacterium]
MNKKTTQLLALKRDLRLVATKERAETNAWFFKTGKGEYGEGDVFLGVTVPQSRALAKKYSDLTFADLKKLLDSKIHEERLVALHILVAQYQKGDTATRQNVYDFYFENLARVNNWDLVDTSASYIVGAHLFGTLKTPTILTKLSVSPNLWERRVAIIATHYFIRQGDFSTTFDISKRLISDKEDLIHKAVGWMLREVGKRDLETLEHFLLEKSRYQTMPRTMLRYAIERFPEEKRKKYLLGVV